MNSWVCNHSGLCRISYTWFSRSSQRNIWTRKWFYYHISTIPRRKSTLSCRGKSYWCYLIWCCECQPLHLTLNLYERNCRTLEGSYRCYPLNWSSYSLTKRKTHLRKVERNRNFSSWNVWISNSAFPHFLGFYNIPKGTLQFLKIAQMKYFRNIDQFSVD